MNTKDRTAMQVARVQATALHLSPRKIYQQHSPPRSHVCVACVHLPIEKKKKTTLQKNVWCEVVCGTRRQHCQEDMVKLVVTHYSPLSLEVHFLQVFSIK